MKFKVKDNVKVVNYQNYLTGDFFELIGRIGVIVAIMPRNLVDKNTFDAYEVKIDKKHFVLGAYYLRRVNNYNKEVL